MKNPGLMCLISAVVTLWLIYDMATASEGISQTLAAMKYILIALLAGVTIFLGVQWLSKRDLAPA